jgi:hypothetical protein
VNEYTVKNQREEESPPPSPWRWEQETCARQNTGIKWSPLLLVSSLTLYKGSLYTLFKEVPGLQETGSERVIGNKGFIGRLQVWTHARSSRRNSKQGRKTTQYGPAEPNKTLERTKRAPGKLTGTAPLNPTTVEGSAKHEPERNQ